MATADGRLALVVRGGWEGHAPLAATDLFIPHLRQHDYRVEIADSPAPYADADLMRRVDLVVQCYTQGSIGRAELDGLLAAVQAGAGLAGWHGGIADAFRAASDYLHLVGGQFATHPRKHPSQWVDGAAANAFVPHRIHLLPCAREHPITAGIDDFDLVTEQYWVLTDAYNDVLATTTHPARAWDPWQREVTCPAIWTRQWGAGRVFVATPGHSVDVLEHPTVRTIIQRGMLWASR